VYSAESQPTFRRYISPQSSHPKNKSLFLQDYSSTLKLEATCSSETSVEFQETIWRYIPEERALPASQLCASTCLRPVLSSIRTIQSLAVIPLKLLQYHKLFFNSSTAIINVNQKNEGKERNCESYNVLLSRSFLDYFVKRETN
jgi:hypothetical protein